jgi:hypothetical protein
VNTIEVRVLGVPSRLNSVPVFETNPDDPPVNVGIERPPVAS